MESARGNTGRLVPSAGNASHERLLLIENLIDVLQAEKRSLEQRSPSVEPGERSHVAAGLRELNTIPDVADFARVSRRTVERAISSGAIPVIRVGARATRIRRDAVLDWLGLSA
jgi:excisionase family DNA binding protein